LRRRVASAKGKGVENQSRKLPTTEQVEKMMAEWGSRSLEAFASEFGLSLEIMEKTAEYLRRLKRVSDPSAIPAVACLREDSLESIVRCAGAKNGYIM
jgi:hypothetical protein